MKKGDIIYVKQGKDIVGRGTIIQNYGFKLCNEIKDDGDYIWPHQVKVNWNKNFIPTGLLLGVESYTVIELNINQVYLIESQERKQSYQLNAMNSQKVNFSQPHAVLESEIDHSLKQSVLPAQIKWSAKYAVLVLQNNLEVQ